MSTSATADASPRDTTEYRWFFILQGVIFIIGGTAAIILPQVATLAFSLFFGVALLVIGLFRFVTLLRARNAPAFWGNLLLSVLMAVLGALLVFRPLEGVLTLTLALAAYFFAHGVTSFYMAFRMRGSTSRWMWLVLGGIVDFALAFLVIAGWPSTATWVLGLLVGINMMFAGFAMIFASGGEKTENNTIAA